MIFYAGCMFDKGINGERDLNRAFGLYLISGMLKYEPALLHVAYCYEHGRGIKVDKKRALELYKEAMDAGLIKADIYYKGLLLEMGHDK